MTFENFLTPVEKYSTVAPFVAAVVGAAPELSRARNAPSSSVEAGLSADDPLVEVARHGLVTLAAYNGLRGPLGDLPVRLRDRVCGQLLNAQELLPAGLKLVILDGWRSEEFQGVLVSHYGNDAVNAGFVSPQTGRGGATPPHVTGGAVDLTIAWNGDALSLGTAFDSFTERAHLHALEDEQSVAREARRLLTHVLTSVGFAPYRQEWWHFSFGDTNWAEWAGVDAPIFGSALMPLK